MFYCTSCIAFFFFYLYCLSVCLYVSCLCLWALLPDVNKMMMIVSAAFFDEYGSMDQTIVMSSSIAEHLVDEYSSMDQTSVM